MTALPAGDDAPPEIEFLTRRHCPLCDDAERLLVVWSGELGFSIEKRDVDADSSLQDRFGSRVPVARTREGIVVAEGRWSEEEAKAAIRRYVGRGVAGPRRGEAE